MATTCRLLGPPELRHAPPPYTTTTEDDPMKSFINQGNPCLDFFFHVVPDTSPGYLIRRLELAWAHNSLTALKLICNLRGVRGTGKSDKEGFYTAVFLAASLPPQDTGWILEGPLVRKIEKNDRRKSKGKNKISRGGFGGRGRGEKRGREI
ncbi:Uncharacterized conserved protein UCP015417 [Abeliophyllum distichum]|uniref:Uncharacterized conserved protein UCP015417 n=1 Tax=Abeliophyllum distichum TaxID=126358 RepID=A0ABD1Q1G5_9LAMI